MTHYGQERYAWSVPPNTAYQPVATSQNVYGEDYIQSIYQQPPSYDTPPFRGYIPPPPPPPPAPPTQGNPTQQPDGKGKGFFSGGWRTGVTGAAFAVFLVFLINVGLTIWATSKYGVHLGLGSIYEGSCAKTKKMSLLIHLGINALATVLLSGSNYCMQCLAAPTRAEVDKAHARRLWVDIGVPSIRNLRRISWGRVILWWCIGLSSAPLHLMYNSSVFSSLASNVYYVTVVPDNYLNTFLGGAYKSYIPGDPNTFNQLDKKTCMQDYGIQFVSNRRDVVVVVAGNGSDWVRTDTDWAAHGISLTGTNTGRMPFDWLCGGTGVTGSCDIKYALASIDLWAEEGGAVQYCLSEPWPEKCNLQFSRDIMIVVIICNAIKFICMILAVFINKESVLTTVGDAIMSFLDNPDRTTVGMCIASKRDIQKGDWAATHPGFNQAPVYRTWHRHRHHWLRATSIGRWIICTIVSVLGMITALAFLGLALSNLGSSGVPTDPRSLWAMGFGAVDIRTVTTPEYGAVEQGTKGVLSNVIIANIPQLGLSVLYLLYNSIFTSMLLANEWDGFSYQRKSLRVTLPVGSQRSTYFLSVPYKYSIPLMIASGGMHWLISQSIFLARVIEYDGNAITQESISAVGFSPIAIYFSIALGCLMLLVAYVNGMRRYSGGIPLAGSCSAAISAACHPGQQGFSDSRSPLQWGVVKIDGNVAHCAFSSEPVSQPLPGGWYAGEMGGKGIGEGGAADGGVRKRMIRVKG